MWRWVQLFNHFLTIGQLPLLVCSADIFMANVLLDFLTWFLPVRVFGHKTQFAISAHPCIIADPKCRTKGDADSFIPRVVSLWNSRPVTCFSLSYNLSTFKRNVNSYFLHLWGSIAFHLTSATSCVFDVFLLFFSFIYLVLLYPYFCLTFH